MMDQVWNSPRRVRFNHMARKFHRQRNCLVAIVVIFLLFCWAGHELLVRSSLDHDHMREHFASKSEACELMSPDVRTAYEEFVKRVLQTFDMFEVKNFLCYQSLWRALRENIKKEADRSSLRLADSCLEICVLNEDLMRHSEDMIERRFRENGITLQYLHLDGLYVLKPSSRLFAGQDSQYLTDGASNLHPDIFSIHARVHVFELDTVIHQYRRVGIKRRLLPPTMCQQLHCFPPDLVESREAEPLPQLTSFLPGISINVPRQGLEIQKYHYPDTWWTLSQKSPCDD